MSLSTILALSVAWLATLITLAVLLLARRELGRLRRENSDLAAENTLLRLDKLSLLAQRQWQRPPHWQDHRRFVASEPVGDWRVR